MCVCRSACVCVCWAELECTMAEFRVKDFAVNQLHKVNDEGNWRPL